MSLEIKFKTNIEKHLKAIEKNEGDNISDNDAKHICHIRQLINQHEDFLELHALLTEYINDEMSIRLFGFLPFVNDLKRDLKNIVEKPEFNPAKYLRSSRFSSRHNSAVDIETTDSINLSDVNTLVHTECDSRFAKLDSEVKQIKESNVFYKAKSEQLEKSVAKLQTDYDAIKNELNEYKKRALAAEAEVEKLNLTILEKNETIAKLNSEVNKLRGTQTVNSVRSNYTHSISSP